MEHPQLDTQPNAGEMDTARRILNLPDGAVLTVDHGGWTSRVYLYGQGQQVVKFPRHEVVKQEYALECAAYRLMEQVDFSPVSLPVLRSVGQDYAYMAYTGIVGQTLDQRLKAQAVSEVQKKQLGQQLGSFLKKLHGLVFSACAEQSLQQEVRVLQKKYQLGCAYLKAQLSSEDFTRLDHWVQHSVAPQLQELGYERVLCHGDLGFWNIVYRETPVGSALGIIDFGDMGYSDVSRDFVGFADAVIRDAALDAYGDTPRLRAKVNYRQKMLPILELPYYLDKQDQKAVRQTLERICVVLKEKNLFL